MQFWSKLIVTAEPHISPEVIVKCFKKCCISNAVDANEDMTCGNIGKRMGMFGVRVSKTKALTVKMETVTLIGIGR
jgi:hypothetical protein